MILGWDIGGVNTKVARLNDNGAPTVRSRPFELQRDPGALVRVLRDLAAEVGATMESGFLVRRSAVREGGSRIAEFTCAVTMTAELSQMFRTKREGVAFVLDAVAAAFPGGTIRVFTTDGRFLTVDAARHQPRAVAAANWAATARIVAQREHRDAVLIDVGTTTTDVIPIVNGDVVAAGTTDPERLGSGELVYSGALRTPVEAIARAVRHRGGMHGVSAEGFALIGDVHLWLGTLDAVDYTVPTPDGRPATREFAGERIARVICADRELMGESEITHVARFIAAEQVAAVAAAVRRVCARHPSLRTAVVTGLGHFIAREAARSVLLDVVSLADDIGDDAARYAAASAVALLYAEGPAKAGHYDHPAEAGHYDHPADGGLHRCGVRLKADNGIDLVIKVGGGLLQHADRFERVVAVISDVSQALRVVIVPGGGPFADAVRHVDERLALGDEAAHWMAILGMDQYAHLLASRLGSGVVVSSREQIAAAHRCGQTPVLAPSLWLRAVDPLPHSWDVTSDSIAAWVAGELGAGRLLLIKPPGARGPTVVDGYFERACPVACAFECLDADEAIDQLSRMTERVAARALEPQ